MAKTRTREVEIDGEKFLVAQFKMGALLEIYDSDAHSISANHRLLIEKIHLSMVRAMGESAPALERLTSILDYEDLQRIHGEIAELTYSKVGGSDAGETKSP